MTQPFSLAQHLKQEHHITPFQTYLKEIVYGGNDGIVTTFAVIAGFTGADIATKFPTYPFFTVFLFGLANLFADGTSMGLGNFLSLRSEQDVYKAAEQKEVYEIENHKESEKRETIAILKEKSFSDTDAKKLTEIYATNKNYWLSFMMNHELEMPNPKKENPFFTGLATFGSFISFGFIPLIPYLFVREASSAFFLSCAATTIALLSLGVLRWRVTRENPVRSILEIVAIGGVSATIAYIVGTFFRV